MDGSRRGMEREPVHTLHRALHTGPWGGGTLPYSRVVHGFDSMSALPINNAKLAATPAARSFLRFRPGIAMRVALGFAAIAVAVIAANLITQHSTRTARERMRQLVVDHEPVMRATESLASAISVYERVVIDRAERGSGSQATVEVA